MHFLIWRHSHKSALHILFISININDFNRVVMYILASTGINYGLHIHDYQIVHIWGVAYLEGSATAYKIIFLTSINQIWFSSKHILFHACLWWKTRQKYDYLQWTLLSPHVKPQHIYDYQRVSILMSSRRECPSLLASHDTVNLISSIKAPYFHILLQT